MKYIKTKDADELLDVLNHIDKQFEPAIEDIVDNCFENGIEINTVIIENISDISEGQYIRGDDFELDLKEDIPEFKGVYFNSLMLSLDYQITNDFGIKVVIPISVVKQLSERIIAQLINYG